MKAKKEYIRKPYVQKVLIIGKKTIGLFERPEWHREFREGHIGTIESGMRRGKHPSENLTVNEYNGNKMRVINGNHRVEAIRRLIDSNPDFSIEMSLTVYYKLSKDEEIAIYERVNNTRRETGLDRLKAHLTGTKILKMFEKHFPHRVLFRCATRGEVNTISAASVFATYLSKDNLSTVMSKGTLEQAKQLDESDYDRMVAYANFVNRTLGQPSRDNVYANFNMYSVVGKLFYSLAGTYLKVDELETRIKKVMARYPAELMLNSRGIHRQKALYSFILENIQGHNKVLNLVTGKVE